MCYNVPTSTTGIQCIETGYIDWVLITKDPGRWVELDDIREGTGSTVAFNIRGKKICKGNGSSALYNSTDGMNNEEIAAVLYALGEIRA